MVAKQIIWEVFFPQCNKIAQKFGFLLVLRYLCRLNANYIFLFTVEY